MFHDFLQSNGDPDEVCSSAFLSICPDPKRRPTKRASLSQTLEILEHRMLLAAQIHFTDFSSTTGLVTNGFGAAPVTSSNKLRMTDGQLQESRSAWFNTAVPIDQFRSDFSYRAKSGDSADGLCFVIQNGPTSALGDDGFDLGYRGIANSEAACLNLFNFGNYGSQFGFASGGLHPDTNTAMAPIDLHSGHLMHATIKYDGKTLNFAVSDATDRSLVFRASEIIDIPARLGTHEAIVGFTASTGDHLSTQDITSWKYDGILTSAPSISKPATANPNPVTGTTAHLDVLGDDAGGESNLTYTWTLQSSPSGAKAPVFSANGTNGAKSITATFFKSGDYVFRCTITNQDDQSVFSDVTVHVLQTATKMRMTPHEQDINLGDTIQYRTTLLDQFNFSMRTQPKWIYSIQSGEGSVDPDSGLFTASPNIVGHVDVASTGGGFTGTCGVTVRK